MGLTERTEQLQTFDVLLSDLERREGRVALLDGPTGSGKSALLNQLAAMATDADALVLRAVCTAAEQWLPFGVFSQLVHSVVLTAELTDRALSLMGDHLSTVEFNDQRSALVRHELCLLLLRMANERPVVLLVDDLQHADLQSLGALSHLSRRLSASALLLVVARDGDAYASGPAPYDEFVRQPQLRRIATAPLSRAGVRMLIAERLDELSARRLTTEFHDASGGNLHLLNALIEDQRRHGRVHAEGYGRAVVDCVRRSGPAALAVARALAVLAGNGTAADAGNLAGLDAAATSEAVHVLTAAGLLRQERLGHAVAATALLGSASPDERADLHQRAAHLVQVLGHEAPVVAHHLAEAGRIDPTWGVPVLLSAAGEALAAAQMPVAVRYLDLAHRSSAPTPERTMIRVKLAQAEWHSYPARAARHLEPLAQEMRTGQLDTGVSVAVIRHLLWHGYSEEAGDALNRLWNRAVEPAGDTGDLRDLHAWLAFNHPPLAHGRRYPAPRPEQRSAAVAAAIDPWLRPSGMLAELLGRGDVRTAARHAEQILADLRFTRDTPWAEELAMLAFDALNQADRGAVADQWCAELCGDTAQRHSPVWQAILTDARAEAALRRGDLSSAFSHAQMALTHMSPRCWGVAVGRPLGTLVLAATRSGRLDEARRQLEEVVPEVMFESRYGLYYLFARGHNYLATNHHHAALANFLSCGDLARSWGIDISTIVPWRTSAAEAWLGLGNEDQARQLVHEQLGRGGGSDARGRATCLRLLAALSPPNRAPQLLGEALDLFEECGDQYEQAVVLTALSRAYSALGTNRRARMANRRGRHLAALCGAAPLCQELISTPKDRDTGQPGREGAATGTLTSSEWRVASLAVRGYTNREIAAKLYVTPSTVEQHLTRIFRKLDIKQRSELPADLHPAASPRTTGAGIRQAGGGRSGVLAMDEAG